MKPNCQSSKGKSNTTLNQPVIPERLYRESILILALIKQPYRISAGACPSMIKAGAGMTPG
jgi:hypothetical protein